MANDSWQANQDFDTGKISADERDRRSYSSYGSNQSGNDKILIDSGPRSTYDANAPIVEIFAVIFKFKWPILITWVAIYLIITHLPNSFNNTPMVSIPYFLIMFGMSLAGPASRKVAFWLVAIPVAVFFLAKMFGWDMFAHNTPSTQIHQQQIHNSMASHPKPHN